VSSPLPPAPSLDVLAGTRDAVVVVIVDALALLLVVTEEAVFVVALEEESVGSLVIVDVVASDCVGEGMRPFLVCLLIFNSSLDGLSTRVVSIGLGMSFFLAGCWG
jgi:hypothetical protein